VEETAMIGRGRRRHYDGGAIVFGVILLIVGGYFLLKNTFGIDMPEIDGDMVWPAALILLGVWIVARAAMGRSGGQPDDQQGS
jgi:uncharacterized integral membrane protein